MVSMLNSFISSMAFFINLMSKVSPLWYRNWQISECMAMIRSWVGNLLSSHCLITFSSDVTASCGKLLASDRRVNFKCSPILLIQCSTPRRTFSFSENSIHSPIIVYDIEDEEEKNLLGRYISRFKLGT